MSRIVNNLINRAYEYINGENPSQTVSGSDVERALDILNEIINDFSTSGLFIPYYNTLTFNLTTGKRSYIFSREINADVNSDKIVSLDFVNYTYSETIYPINIMSRSEYYKFQRQKSLTGIPAFVFLQNTPDESILTFLPIPDKDYECEIVAKFELGEVALFSDLSAMPKYYDRFLKYALARELSIIIGSDETRWSPLAESKYQEMYNHLLIANDIDLEIKTNSALKLYQDYSSGYRARDV